MNIFFLKQLLINSSFLPITSLIIRLSITYSTSTLWFFSSYLFILQTLRSNRLIIGNSPINAVVTGLYKDMSKKNVNKFFNPLGLLYIKCIQALKLIKNQSQCKEFAIIYCRTGKSF